MVCSTCHSKIGEDCKFCPHCGKSVEEPMNVEDTSRMSHSSKITYESTAIASFILAIIGIFTFSLTSIPAFIFGFKALKLIKNNNRKGTVIAQMAIVISLLLIVFTTYNVFFSPDGLLNSTDSTAELRSRLQQEKKERLDIFNANRATIISELNQLLIQKKYHEAMNESKKYLHSGDNELIEINNIATSKYGDLRSKTIIKELKNIPSSEIEKNLSLYKELQSLNPKTILYKNKVKYYSDRLSEKKRRFANASESKWSVGVFVDEFGERTNNKFVGADFFGKMYNTATNGSSAKIQFYFTPDRTSFVRIYEYGSKPVTGYSRGTKYNFKFRGNDGKDVSFSWDWYETDAIVFGPKNTKIMHELFTNNTTVKARITNIERPTSYYNFTLDCFQFSEVMSQL